jgi:hypothetical protein
MTEGRSRIYQAASKILNILMENAAASEDRRLTRHEVFAASSLDEETFHIAYMHLRELGYVMATSSDEDMWITAEGMKSYYLELVRGDLRSHRAVLENFKANPPSPPLNNVFNNYGHISNAQIQQGTTHSSQSGSSTSISIEELSRLLEELRASLGKLGLSADDETEAKAAIAHTEAQLCSLPQNQGLLRESLGTVKRIFEGAASSTLGSLLAQKIAQFLSYDTSA